MDEMTTSENDAGAAGSAPGGRSARPVTRTPEEWNQRYLGGQTPWDSGIRSRELARVLAEGRVRPGRAVELGCGTGTNAVFLAQQGFQVTAIDCAPLALAAARRQALQAGVAVEFHEADLCRFEKSLEPFDFVFDRGCYHCARRVDLAGFLRTVQSLTRAGSRYLVLTGNANEGTDEGPPRLHEREIRDELEGLFQIEFIREIRFEDPGGVDGPLGWSCLMTRR